MSGDDSYYYFYLNEQLTMDRIKAIYTDIWNSYPKVGMSLPFEEMVGYSYDGKPRLGKDGGNVWGRIYFEDGINLEINNCDLGGSTGYHNYPPHLRGGERQLRIAFESRLYLSVLVSEDHDLGHRMLPILSSIARHSNPFFGFYVSGSVLDADLVPVDSREIEYLRALFEFPSFWGSLFFDDDLIEEVGPDHLDRWVELKTAVDGRGYFLERGGIPLHGSVQEDPPTFELRNRLFRDAMAPRILERLTREFGME